MQHETKMNEIQNHSSRFTITETMHPDVEHAFGFPDISELPELSFARMKKRERDESIETVTRTM